jgi:beta-ureidopropionase / N-carbamoyl-L-amino-acid hydrolase
MLTFAATVLAAHGEALHHGALATIGHAEIAPNATNAIPSVVSAWLDARAPDEATLEALVTAIGRRAYEFSQRDHTDVLTSQESVSPAVDFDAGLRDASAAALGGAPILPTGAGHDAGVLSGHVPTAMLFVRNPTGVSHAPAEYATDEDCAAGVRALARVLEELACR